MRAIINRLGRAAAIAMCVVALLGCTSEKKGAYEEIASTINPLLHKMTTAAQAVLGVNDSHAERYRACTSADAALRSLSEAPIHASLAVVNPPGMRVPSLPEYARALLQDRGERCVKVDQTCSDFCRWGWQSMVDDVKRMRWGAEALDVGIFKLGE